MAVPGDGSTLSERERETIRAAAFEAAQEAPPMSLQHRRELAALFGLVLDEDLPPHAAGS